MWRLRHALHGHCMGGVHVGCTHCLLAAAVSRFAWGDCEGTAPTKYGKKTSAGHGERGVGRFHTECIKEHNTPGCRSIRTHAEAHAHAGACMEQRRRTWRGARARYIHTQEHVWSRVGAHAQGSTCTVHAHAGACVEQRRRTCTGEHVHGIAHGKGMHSAERVHAQRICTCACICSENRRSAPRLSCGGAARAVEARPLTPLTNASREA